MMDTELPKGWNELSLGDIASVTSGGTPSRANKEYWGGNIPWVKISDMQGMYVDHTEEFITENGLKNSSAKLLPKGTILLSIFATIGRVSILNIDATTNQAIAGITPSPNFNKLFVAHALVHFSGKLLEQGKGVAQKNINQSILKELVLPIPPAAEQKRIADKLDVLFGHMDVVKRKLDRIPDILKRFRQAVLTQAVTGKLTEEWRATNIITEDGKQFVRTVLSARNIALSNQPLEFPTEKNPYTVPDTWTFTYLENFGELTRGKSKHRPRNDPKLFENGKYPFIQTGDVARSNGFIKSYTNMYSDFGLAQSRLFPKGTLCITIAANIADTGILDFDACFPDSVVGFIPFENLYSSKFAMFYIRTIKENLEHLAPATAQKNINLQVLSELPFPVPPYEEQKQIIKKVDDLFAIADNIERFYNKLQSTTEALPKSILSRAFRGELVEQDPNDKAIEVPHITVTNHSIEYSKPVQSKSKTSKIKPTARLEKRSLTAMTKDVLSVIKERFGNQTFSYEDLSGTIQNNTRLNYIETKKQFFTLLRNSKLKKKTAKLESEIDEPTGTLKFKLVEP